MILTSMQVAILLYVYKQDHAAGHRLRQDNPEIFEQEMFVLRSKGLIDHKYELTEKGRRIVELGE